MLVSVKRSEMRTAPQKLTRPATFFSEACLRPLVKLSISEAEVSYGSIRKCKSKDPKKLGIPKQHHLYLTGSEGSIECQNERSICMTWILFQFV